MKKMKRSMKLLVPSLLAVFISASLMSLINSIKGEEIGKYDLPSADIRIRSIDNYEDGVFYIGQYKNGLKYGKGTMYYSNGNIMYEGDYVNDEYEGNGKYIWEDGEYYIGQYKNGLKNEKGTMYYSNRTIKYYPISNLIIKKAMIFKYP